MANKYTANGADLQAVANAIREKGGTSSPLTFPGGFVEAIGDIETGGGGQPSASQKAVNFIDYDGSILYSYSESEALALTALPANPSHSGLTAQGWNWTLAQIKAQLTAMPGASVWVGQMYITDDGKTRIYCHFNTGRLAPYLGLGVNGTVTVDWGDGTSTDTLTGTSLETVTSIQHTFLSAGDYTIILTPVNGSFALFGADESTHILRMDVSTTGVLNYVYTSAVQHIEMGEKASIGEAAFYGCSNLASITIPDSVTSIGEAAFYGCSNLAFITIPDSMTSIGEAAFNSCSGLAFITIPYGVTSIGEAAFYGCSNLVSITIPYSVTSIDNATFNSCSNLASITMPNSVTSIGIVAFSGCYNLASITIPDSVTSIGEYAFGGCSGLGEIHFFSSNPPYLLSSDTFADIPTDCKIYVPAGSLTAYTSATNYPSSSTYTYIEE